MLDVASATILDEVEWREQAARHADRVLPWVEGRLSRRSAGRKDPVDDFLFDYYPYSIARLSTWHPGHGVEVRGDVSAFLGHPDYRATDHGATTNEDRLQSHRPRLALAIRLLADSSGREPQFGCFGMHEWAMVHGLGQGQVRHSSHPLRLAPAEIVGVVEETGLRCTHIDAYRFFTATSRPLNAFEPTRTDQHRWEQPGCLHANMDLYKYGSWFSPFVASDLVADCFELAREAREVDMRAAPYDLSDLGYQPIPVETPDGRRQYVSEQRRLSTAAQPLRVRLLNALQAL